MRISSEHLHDRNLFAFLLGSLNRNDIGLSLKANTDISEWLENNECPLDSVSDNFIKETETRYEEHILKGNMSMKILQDDDRYSGSCFSAEVLYYFGELPDIDKPSVALIGSRAATNYGMSMAEYLAEVMTKNGVQVISGLNNGIEASAVKGSLKNNGTCTVVMASGVDCVYPAVNTEFYYKVRETGCLVSSFPPGVRYGSANFGLKGDVITSLADVVCVVEAREKSGVISVADLAYDKGKDICAVPGRATDPMSRSCNQLIRAGATLVQSPEDILDILDTHRNA